MTSASFGLAALGTLLVTVERRHLADGSRLALGHGMQAVLYGMAVVMAVAAIIAAAFLHRGIHAAPDAREPDNTPADSTAAPVR